MTAVASRNASAMFVALLCAVAGQAVAQSSAQSEAGEPRADTSAPAPSPPTTTAAAPAPSTSATSSAAAAPAAAIATPPAPGSTRAAPTRQVAATHPTPGAADRLSLGTATVTGDREQPKVMYIVPWKRSDIGDLSGKPMNSLLDEALAPIDRDEFKREVAYFDAINADAPGAAAPGAAAPGTGRQGAVAPHNGAPGPADQQVEK